MTKDIGANEPVLSTSAALFAANNRAFCFFFTTRTTKRLEASDIIIAVKKNYLQIVDNVPLSLFSLR